MHGETMKFECNVISARLILQYKHWGHGKRLLQRKQMF